MVHDETDSSEQAVSPEGSPSPGEAGGPEQASSFGGGFWPEEVSEDELTPQQAAALAMFDDRLKRLAERENAIIGKKNLWLAHHWPEHYAERCIKIGHRHVCRRCAALYPVGLLVAILTVAGALPWPESVDPLAIWLLSIPATVAYCGEALGFFRYDPRVQVITTLIAALAFGRGLGYELDERWSTEFWGPIAVFGGIWFFATVVGLARRKHTSNS